MTSERAAAADKASVLIEALPYIRSYHGETVVVKVGGAPLENPSHAARLADDLALLALVGIRIVVVHGGGPQVSRSLTALGMEPRFIEGLRVTSAEVMQVVEQVLVGEMNPSLVRALSAAGLSAVGVSGSDGGLLRAARRRSDSGADIGLVGEVKAADPRILESLLETGYTPVVATVAPDESGTALNLNADVAAAAIAAALDASKLVYLTNVEGLYGDLAEGGTLISELKAEDLTAMIPGLSEGMRPKAASAVHALQHGVGKVHILDGRVAHALLLEVFTDEGIGTQVLP